MMVNLELATTCLLWLLDIKQNDTAMNLFLICS
jgi:hypothetical protein